MIIRQQRYNIPTTTKKHPHTVFINKNKFDKKNEVKKSDIKRELTKIDLNTLL